MGNGDGFKPGKTSGVYETGLSPDEQEFWGRVFFEEFNRSDVDGAAAKADLALERRRGTATKRQEVVVSVKVDVDDKLAEITEAFRAAAAAAGAPVKSGGV